MRGNDPQYILRRIWQNSSVINWKGNAIMKSILIKDTTREEREKIVSRALSDCGGECEFCNGCDNLGGGRVDEIYRPYIDGEKEIAEINADFYGGLVRG